jgi:glycosyltransferase involved in cell wall biosynthesis
MLRHDKLAASGVKSPAMTDAAQLPELPLRVVMIAYACSPKLGGEHLLGWNWARRLAEKGHEVVVVTARHRIEDSQGCCPARLQVVAVNDARFAHLRKLRFLRFVYYWLWNRSAARIARCISNQLAIDVVHQCTFHTFRIPCLPALWGTVPVVWGPIAGLERIPIGLLPVVGWGSWWEVIRAVANQAQLHLPTIRRSLRAADHVIVSNHDTRRRLERLVHRHYEHMPANAVELPAMGEYLPPRPGRLEIMAVGALVPMRPYSLVLRAIAEIEPLVRAGLTLTFIGAGPSEVRLKEQVRSLNLGDTVRFLGVQPRCTTLELMRKGHLLIFPSLRDSGGSSVAEAMSMGLPVLAFDLAGPGAMLATGGGFLIEARSPRRLVAEIKNWLLRLLEHPELLKACSREGRQAALRLFDWPQRIYRIETLYRSAMRNRTKSS